MSAAVPTPRPLRTLGRSDVALGLMYTSGGYWCSREEDESIEAALAEARPRMDGEVFDAAGALLASLVRVQFEERVAQRAAFVAVCLFLNRNRRPAPQGLDQDAAFELVEAAAEGRAGALEAGDRLRALWQTDEDTENDNTEDGRDA